MKPEYEAFEHPSVQRPFRSNFRDYAREEEKFRNHADVISHNQGARAGGRSERREEMNARRPSGWAPRKEDRR